MSSIVPVKQSASPPPAPRLSTMLVVPIPSHRPRKKKFWRVFLNDLSFLLPTCAALLGLLLLFGQAPYLGASLMTIGTCLLALRVHSAVESRRERRRMEQLDQWYRAYARRGVRPPSPFHD